MPLRLKKALRQKWLDALVIARTKAADSHRQARMERMKKIEGEARHFLKDVNLNRAVAELIFSSFYLAE